jgi:hypothetical protein
MGGAAAATHGGSHEGASHGLASLHGQRDAYNEPTGTRTCFVLHASTFFRLPFVSTLQEVTSTLVLLETLPSPTPLVSVVCPVLLVRLAMHLVES